MSIVNPIESPCINVCELNSAQICSGCGRHIDEIVVWGQLNKEQRRAVIALAQVRRENLAGECK
jgi:predicted Fe-S protein YdhL (DUF1289 family)